MGALTTGPVAVEMSVNALLLACGAAALVAVVDAEDREISGRVVDGVLALLGVTRAQQEEDSGDQDTDGDTKPADPGERDLQIPLVYHHRQTTL